MLSHESLRKLRYCMVEAFEKTHQELERRSEIDTNFSGTTAVTVFIRGNTCICSNCGDSRAVIGRLTRSGWVAVALSRDHKPDIPEERERIEKSDGRIAPFRDLSGSFLGPDRVWLKNQEIPGLAMSRSIGDLVAREAGVISTPEIMMHELDVCDKFVILASDGVWEFISSEECVSIVANYYFSGKLSAACEQIANLAVFRWNREDTSVDDITVIIASLKVKDENTT